MTRGGDAGAGASRRSVQEESRSADCARCGGSGVVGVAHHASGRTPLRCAGACPQMRPAACEMCVRRALGDDLMWSA